jgi:hypothetical protein
MVLGAVLSMSLCARDGLAAQGFGFGDEGSEDDFFGAPASFAVSIGGEVSASLLGYVDDFSDGADSVRLSAAGDVFSGKLNFKAGVSNADAAINLKLAPVALPASPVAIDEAYLRAYFGSFDIEGGLRKLTWGKADSMGPLDVINPLDYSDLSLLVDNSSDAMTMKIARPLVRVTWNAGSFSKLEGVFVPTFEGTRFAAAGNRWVPSQVASIPAGLPVIQADTSTLDYAQAGLRFTTTIGSSDIGAQYYYGRLPLPAFIFSFGGGPPMPTAVKLDYNRYHQIGVDFARVVAGFNVRSEAAANLTEDFGGDDGTVYNPRIAWSLGFDRDVVAGINLNLQAAETVILLHDKIGRNPLLDIEAGSDATSTRITAKLSKTFFRDELEIAASAIWGIEDRDCLIMPAITWTKGDVAVELSSGIFAGEKDGQFGQYRDNSFVRVRMKYTF